MPNNETIRYFVVGVKNDDIGLGFVREVFLKSGIEPVSVNEVDAEQLPRTAMETPTEEDLFRRAVIRIRRDPTNKYHPIIHALEENGGTVSIKELKSRGENGIPDELIELILKTFSGTINRNPDDPNMLTCDFFKRKDGVEAVPNP